ncbi:MAG TPA: SH3 domain-containing protein [Opitutaceae bacterium]|nr:SH3 domain-containing protein [Opitutaceae bacterium]
MKVNRLLLAAALTAGAVRAAPLTETTAVQARPEAGAPALAVLKPGTEPTPAAGITAPPGWLAVEVPGPREAYVLNRDFLKSLDVRPGAPIYTAPKLDAPILTNAEKGDQIEITGLLGKWTQIKLARTLTGYIQLPSALPATPAAVLPPPPPPPPVAINNSAPGHAVSSDVSTLPRLLEGKIVSTRRPFAPRRPYDYELDDASGSRLAYLDSSHLLLTAQMDGYVGHTVAVYGTVKPIEGGSDLVITAESLQLK